MTRSTVADFFNSIASTYNFKYDKQKNSFLAHFFEERLKAAVQNARQPMGIVLDIGAGTGQLYNYLIDKKISFDDFWAVDISSSMLNNSSIPEDRRIVGTVNSSVLSPLSGTIEQFFMLGVTTYMSIPDIQEALRRIQELADRDAELSITFTNNRSVESRLQRLIASALKMSKRVNRDWSNRYVASQTFDRTTLCESEMRSLLSPHGEIVEVNYQNQTFTPLNRIAPKFSICVERQIQKVFGSNPRMMAAFSSDIHFRLRIAVMGVTPE
ncbi:MAG: hypothetical protein Q7N95_14670 [Alphaproteobacteria bacterium]|nr:hypothetical protein [Alphaproteobacteria bacterium]